MSCLVVLWLSTLCDSGLEEEPGCAAASFVAARAGLIRSHLKPFGFVICCVWLQCAPFSPVLPESELINTRFDVGDKGFRGACLLLVPLQSRSSCDLLQLDCKKAITC